MKYHIITWTSDTGYDDKLDYPTLQQAKVACAGYLKEEYEEVYIITDHTIVCVFDENHPKGRNPYTFELLKFRFK